MLLNVVLRTGYLVPSDRRPPPYALLTVKVGYKVGSSQACEHRNRDRCFRVLTIRYAKKWASLEILAYQLQRTSDFTFLRRLFPS